MKNQRVLRAILSFLAFLACMANNTAGRAAEQHAHSAKVTSCIQNGWKPLHVEVTGNEREMLWKRPRGKWKRGAIVILHGGGGSHYQFCTGGKILQPQIEFAEEAVEEGFAVFLLDSTDGVVTDAKGKNCGKRFDFSVLDRSNVDLAFIGKVINRLIPQLRSSRSSKKIFLTGLSTGGYMAIRTAVRFNNKITAFAPVSAGDPYGTRTNCDARLSKRKSAKGILLDLETNKPITVKGACSSNSYPNEKDWPRFKSKHRPAFKQFHNRGDAIVDISCMKKVQNQLQQHGYVNKGEFVLDSDRRRVLNHLWLKRYNDEILEFFKSQ